jgi:NADH-quinone oxidoreductase subunit J
MSDLLLGVASLLTVFAAFGVILSREAVHSALFLTVHLLGVGSLFLFLTHQFLAVAQMLVYAGAVMVVFMFAVTTLPPKEDPLRMLPLKPIPAFGILAGLGICGMLWASLSAAHLNDRVAPAGAQLVTVQSFALDLFGPYLLPFEGTAFLLLVALIGAVLLGTRSNLKPVSPVDSTERAKVDG